MPDRDAKRLDRKIDPDLSQPPRKRGRFPALAQGTFIAPGSRLDRTAVDRGGVVGFLPVVGFCMVPLGALLLAQDVPFLQRPILRLLTWLERKWIKWKRGLRA